MKVKDLLKLLERDGWRLVKTKGSHRQFKHLRRLARPLYLARQALMCRRERSTAF